MTLFTKRRSILWSLLLGLLLLAVHPVLGAARPEINVLANWTPSEQLTSIAGDDRFVDLQLYAQGNAQFWAAEIGCSIGRGDELEFVSINFPTNVWGTINNTMTIVPPGTDQGDGTFTYPTPTDIYNGDGRGGLEFTATRLGITTAPLGTNGQDYTILLATVRFRVLDLDRDSRVRTSCRTLNFLNRDGETAVRGRQTRSDDLEVLIGYTLEGTVLRQGARSHDNVEVTCTNVDTANVYGPVMSGRRGEFEFGGARDKVDALRDFGLYRCDFISMLDGANPDTAFLDTEIYFYLNTPSYTLLPIYLRAGDFEPNPGGNDLIDVLDVVEVTTNYGTSVANAYDTGDANGDRNVDDSDLAIIAANAGLDASVNPLEAAHLVYGLGRDFDPDEAFPNSKLWWGTPGSGQTFALDSRSRTRDFWPNVSPNGLEAVYVTEDSRSGLHELAVIDMTSGRSSSYRTPRGWTDHILAPSFSPDGSRIAFICTEEGDLVEQTGYLYNEGDICILNAGDTRFDTLVRLDVSSEIFPPAWMEYDADDTTPEVEAAYLIIYPGTDGQLHYYDFLTELSGTVPVNGAGGNTLDLPVVQTYIRDLAGPDLYETYLAYRFDDGGDPYIKIGSIEYDPTTGFDGNVITTAHISFDGTGTPDTRGVDYFDVSPGLDVIMYYEYNYAIANTLAPNQFHIFDHNDATPLTWQTSAVSFFVDSVVGNPVGNLNGSGIWQPGSNSATELHAHRMAFDYIP